MNGADDSGYSFTQAELKCLALLFRRHEASLDGRLDGFKDFVEGCVYRAMTIEEAEEFFR